MVSDYGCPALLCLNALAVSCAFDVDANGERKD